MNTTVSALITKIKRRVDYNNTGDTDFEALLLDIINDNVKLLKQWLFDADIISEVSDSATLTTTASQAYVDLSNTPSAPVATLVTIGTGLLTNGDYSYKATFITADGESDVSAVSNTVTVDAAHNKITVSSIPVHPSSKCTSRKLYRTIAGGSTYKYLATISDNTTTTYTDNIADISLGADAPSVDTIPSILEIVTLSERSNDKTIEVLDYNTFLTYYSDPSASSSTMPDHAALWNKRLYLGPMPSAASTLYVEYIKQQTELLSTSNLPFDNKYDQLLIAMAHDWYLRWQDSADASSIQLAEKNMLRLKNELINGASNVNKNRQVQSRRDSQWIGPRIPLA